MNIKNRVATLERESGINEPCEVCEAGRTFVSRVHELASSFNIAMPEPQAHEIIPSICCWCLRPTKTDGSGMTDDERAAYQLYFTCLDEGLLCAPKNTTV